MSVFRLFFAFGFFAVFGLLVGCQGQSGTVSDGGTTAVSPISAVPSGDNGYPGAAMAAGGYPGWSTGDSVQMITRTPDPTLDPNAPIPTPNPGAATLTGYIFSSVTNQPLVDVPVSLAEIYRNAENQGAFAYDTAFSPMTLTDSNGRFILANVEAKEYVMVVGSVEVNRYEIMLDGSGGGLIFSLQPGEITDAGTLRVGFEWQ